MGVAYNSSNTPITGTLSGPYPDGVSKDDTVNSKYGFYGATPIVQPSGAAQAAVAVTGATQTTPWGFTTSTQANAIVTLVNEMRRSLVALGFMKGSA